MHRCMRHSDRTSHIIWIVAAVVGASACGIGLLGLDRFVVAVHEGASLGFKSLCDTHHT